ncbi:hypothetical protein EV126DRAFT_99787 [Verticillium dahliae]|nr:hypothetical protein EV126DRAFT_99787 [Verticillium dahliae]
MIKIIRLLFPPWPAGSNWHEGLIVNWLISRTLLTVSLCQHCNGSLWFVRRFRKSDKRTIHKLASSSALRPRDVSRTPRWSPKSWRSVQKTRLLDPHHVNGVSVLLLAL